MQIDPRVLPKSCFQLFKPSATENVSDWVISHACWFLHRHNVTRAKLPQQFQTACGELWNPRLHTDEAAFRGPWVDASCIYESLHVNFVVFIMFTCFFLTAWGLPTPQMGLFGEHFFQGMWLSVCRTQLPWPLSICICFSFYRNTLPNCPFHPCITQPLSILLCELLNCFSYLADWFWLALLSLGSLTGWRGAAVYTIAGKLVNLKCPGI